MRILVFADSHTDTDTMKMVTDKTNPDMIIHLGDHIIDAIMLRSKYTNIQFEMVKGNCDHNSQQPAQKIINVGSYKIFVAHGDTYQVENGIGQIVTAGKEEGAQVILHGHTHKPSLSIADGITIMNPGRIGRISSKKINASFGIMDIKENSLSCSISFLDNLQTGG